MKLDEKDEIILSMLRENARASNVAIAAKAGLTEGAVRNRIERLLRDGIISRFTVDVTMGSRFGIVMVKAKGDTKRMMKDISRSGLAKDAYEISGEFDGCIILEGASIEDIDAKIDKLRALRSVAGTNTYISLRKW